MNLALGLGEVQINNNMKLKGYIWNNLKLVTSLLFYIYLNVEGLLIPYIFCTKVIKFIISLYTSSPLSHAVIHCMTDDIVDLSSSKLP